MFFQTKDEEKETFLGELVVRIPPILEQLGLSHHDLIEDLCFNFDISQDRITNEVLLALDDFRNTNSKPEGFVYRCIQSMYKPYCELPVHKIQTKLKKARKLKMAAKKGGTANNVFINFIKELVFEVNVVNITPTTKPDVHLNQIQQKESAFVPDLKRQITFLKEESISLKDQLEIVQKEFEEYKIKSKKPFCRSKAVQTCTSTNTVKKSKSVQTNNVIHKSKAVQVCSLSPNLEQDLAKLEKKSLKFEKTQQIFEDEKTELQSKLDQCKIQLHSEQKMKSQYKKDLLQTKETVEALFEAPDQHDGNVNKNNVNLLVTTGNKGKLFSENVRLTYMSLQGEADVAASKCSLVINIISKYLYENEIPMSDLPCTQSALNFSSEGLFLSMVQVAETIHKTEHFTLGTDETGRNKKRLLERHIYLSTGGSMSLGFTEIASENADTLLDVSISLLKDLCETYCSVDDTLVLDSLFREMLVKLKCLMSDRAAVMKLFDKKMAAFKNQFLGEDCTTHFLFCNAHFLLGLTSVTETVMKTIDSNFLKEKIVLGRDNDPHMKHLFQNSSEVAALRVVRAAAEIFGPRGDEKNGCRNEWLVYVKQNNEKSRFTSYRSNRFNNIFDNSSALLYHRDMILKFLKDMVSHENTKFKSIIMDLEDPHIISMVSAIAKFNFLVSNPYWLLIQSEKSYGDFPPYVKMLQTFFKAGTITQFPVFEEFKTQSHNFPLHTTPEVEEVFRKMCVACEEVLTRQLSDFIDDGVFAGEIPTEVMAVLQTCPLSNLTGERLFGDLDYDIQKRRNASLHLRSSINMWRHNRTGFWLRTKKKKTAIHFLSRARSCGPEARRKSVENEKKVRCVIIERLKENERIKREKELKERTKHLDILNAVVDQGGVCTTKEEVDRLMEGGRRVESLKAQIRYRKVILKEKDLSLTGDYTHLYRTLITKLGSEPSEPPKKKAKHD